jgi:predicted peroxiredoxin
VLKQCKLYTEVNQMNNKETYFYALTRFDDPDQIALPLVLANAALAMGAEVTLWTTLEGVKLGKTGAIDKLMSPTFASIKDLLDQFIQTGGRMGVCPACAKTHGVTEENLLENGTWMGAAAVQEALLDRNIMTF